MRVERFNYPVLSLALLALIGFGVGGANQTKAAAADTEQEQVLLSSGFKVKSASTAGGRGGGRALAGNEVFVFKKKGNTHFPYPAKKKKTPYTGGTLCHSP